MKKFISLYLGLFFMFACLPCYSKNSIDIVAYKLSKKEAVIENIDKKLVREFIPIRLEIYNNTGENLSFKPTAFYNYRKENYRAPLNTYLYQKTKRHLWLRAIIWGGIGCGVLSWWFVPLSMTDTFKKNNNLKNNINKNNLKKEIVFKNENYVTYTFLPKKHKKTDAITLFFEQGEKEIKVTTPIVIEEL
ncbi:MAG: hypothetical protein PHV68_00635 [Candidatus Gastranaerophilales bacterium]|nr:hypothetical protein [Candidatus Gastranaerophilales bacterium]